MAKTLCAHFEGAVPGDGEGLIFTGVAPGVVVEVEVIVVEVEVGGVVSFISILSKRK